jgi:hypothetical protein
MLKCLFVVPSLVCLFVFHNCANANANVRISGAKMNTARVMPWKLKLTVHCKHNLFFTPSLLSFIHALQVQKFVCLAAIQSKAAMREGWCPFHCPISVSFSTFLCFAASWKVVDKNIRTICAEQKFSVKILQTYIFWTFSYTFPSDYRF